VPDPTEALDELFAVLADPTRRSLVLRLVHEGPDSATRLAAGYPLSRQAVVKHLQALAEVGLVAAERDGREVLYRATTARLADAIGWLLDAGATWDRRVDRLRARAQPG
jgi:DNA-binding transcriptional ArsR family regulator